MKLEDGLQTIAGYLRFYGAADGLHFMESDGTDHLVTAS